VIFQNIFKLYQNLLVSRTEFCKTFRGVGVVGVRRNTLDRRISLHWNFCSFADLRLFRSTLVQTAPAAHQTMCLAFARRTMLFVLAFVAFLSGCVRENVVSPIETVSVYFFHPPLCCWSPPLVRVDVLLFCAHGVPRRVVFGQLSLIES
jgi:hypothetical protein